MNTAVEDALKQVGIKAKTIFGEPKTEMQILKEVAKKWKSFCDEDNNYVETTTYSSKDKEHPYTCKKLTKCKE